MAKQTAPEQTVNPFHMNSLVFSEDVQGHVFKIKEVKNGRFAGHQVLYLDTPKVPGRAFKMFLHKELKGRLPNHCWVEVQEAAMAPGTENLLVGSTAEATFIVTECTLRSPADIIVASEAEDYKEATTKEDYKHISRSPRGVHVLKWVDARDHQFRLSKWLSFNPDIPKKSSEVQKWVDSRITEMKAKPLNAAAQQSSIQESIDNNAFYDTPFGVINSELFYELMDEYEELCFAAWEEAKNSPKQATQSLGEATGGLFDYIA